MTVAEQWRELTYPWGDDLTLGTLRADYPHTGILHLAEHRWVALWGTTGYLEAASAAELRTLLEAG